MHGLVPVRLVFQGTWVRAKPQRDVPHAKRTQTFQDEIVALHAQRSSGHACMAFDVSRTRGESPHGDLGADN